MAFIISIIYLSLSFLPNTGYDWRDALTLGYPNNAYNGEIHDVGQTEFNRIVREDSPYHIIKRECDTCTISTHQYIYYRRFTDIDSYDYYNVMKLWTSTNNALGTDFNLYSTLEDAIANTNAWTTCNYDDFYWGIGAFRDCGPFEPAACQVTGDKTARAWNRFTCTDTVYGMHDTKFSIYVTNTNATTNPTTTPTIANCEDLGLIKHVNWDNMVNNGGNEIPKIDYEISVSSQNMTLSIDIELDYLGYSYVGNDYGFGTRYHLGFYSFDKDSIISNCDNRMASSFVNRTWTQQWEYSEFPYQNGSIASDDYLAYPPPSEYWLMSMDSNQSCSRIRYNADFGWDDLIGCKSDDGNSTAVDVDIDDKFINMSGTFYVEVISPVSMVTDIDYYRTYQLLSYSFLISVKKSLYAVQDGVDILVFASSIMSVRKSDESTLEIIILTESTDSLLLSNPILLSSPDYDETKFTIANTNAQCLTLNSNICSQIWEITGDIGCPFTFDGDFAFQFDASCNGNSQQCTDYLNTYGTSVSLTAGLIFEDSICENNLYEIEYNAAMGVQSNGSSEIAVIDERVFMEIVVNDFNVDENGYSVFDLQLLNVWLCTNENNDLSLDVNDPTNSGCFSADIDSDGPYHIIVNYDEAFTNNAQHEDDGSNNVARFSFIVPDTIIRDTLFVQSQLNLKFNEDDSNRRLLGSDDDKIATQIIYGSQTISVQRNTQIVDDEVFVTSNDDEHEEQKQCNNGCINMFFAAVSITFAMNLV